MTKRRPVPLTALSAAIGLVALAVPSQAYAACAENAYIGSICVTAAIYCPANTVEANGALYPTTTFEPLYSLIGFTFGGSVEDKAFGVPDLRGRSIIGKGQGSGLADAPYGKPRGVDTVKQLTRNLAPHSHTVVFGMVPTIFQGTIAVVAGSAVTGEGTNAPAEGVVYSLGGVGGKSKYGPYTTKGATVTPAAVEGTFAITTLSPSTETASAGTAERISNLPPQLPVRFCIVTDGLYPERP